MSKINKLQNLNCIGHNGNFCLEKKSNSQAESSTNDSEKRYLYEFAAANDQKPLVEMQNISDLFEKYLSGSHQVTMLTLGLNSIFPAAQGSPFTGLENTGLLKMFDIAHLMKGFQAPLPLMIKIGQSASQGRE